MCCTLPYWSRMASTGQIGPQAPQSMHRSGQMMCSPLRSPVIASVGQRFTQAVQPMQVSMMRKAIDRPLYRQWVAHPRRRRPTRPPTRLACRRGAWSVRSRSAAPPPASSAAPQGERARVAKQAVRVVRIVVTADATHAVHQDQPLAVHDVERRQARIDILARNLGHRGVEAAYHRPLHFPLVAGERAPEDGARSEFPVVLAELLRGVPLRIDADREQADVAPLLGGDEAVLELLHLRLQARARVGTRSEDEVGNPDPPEQVVLAERLS